MTKILKRSLAMVLALLIVLSGANLSAMSALAAGDVVEMSHAAIVAANYDLSDAEKALLNSGYLKSETAKYVVPDGDDGLVVIDTEAQKIIAESYKDSEENEWNPTTATVTYGGQTKVVDIAAGEYYYSGEEFGNAFSVEVEYVAHIDVATTEQANYLAVPGYLKQGYKNLTDVAGEFGNLGILEMAMPTLLEMRDMQLAGNGLAPEVKDIINDWNAQVAANGGQLDISVMIAEYEAAESKSAYLVANGKKMQEELIVFVDQVTQIEKTFSTIYSTAQIVPGLIPAEQVNNLDMFVKILNNLKSGLAAAAADEWYVANNTDILVSTGVGLDVLVAALGAITDVNTNEKLVLAETNITVNLAMWNVTVTVKVEAVNANNEMVVIDEEQVVLTLADGATAEEVLAAVENSGVDSPSGVVEGKYDKVAGELPETLAADFTYTITYSPKVYTVDVAGEVTELPYGYKFTLPEHEDAAQAYDYYLDGSYYAQGTVVVVEDNMTFTREIGAAYKNSGLYAIVATNAKNDQLTAVLTSGALNTDEAVNYRVPTDIETLVVLDGNKLTAATYPASYAGFDWVPYSYVVDGDERFFNGATEVEIAGEFDKVEVFYRLTLANYTEEDIAGVIAFVNLLIGEAEGQLSVLNRLAGYEVTLGQLDKAKLGALNGVIGVADISPELKEYFGKVISDIINNCVDSNNFLKIYNIVKAYNDPQNGGLAYYYANSEMILNELNVLVGYFNMMVLDGDGFTGAEKTAALETIVTAAGFPEYAEKIYTVQENLDSILADLKAPNAAIDTKSANLHVLADALTNGAEVEVAAFVPYLQLGPVTRASEKFVAVTVEVVYGDETVSNTVTIEKDSYLDEAEYKLLRNWAYEVVSAYDADFYASDVDLLHNKLIEYSMNPAVENFKATVTVTAKNFTVKIDGEADQVISADTTWTITLPSHPQAAAGMSYTYTVDGVECNAGIYTFKAEQVKALFVDGVYTITRVEKNEATEKLVKMVNTMNEEIGYEAIVLVEENGLYTGIVANIGMGDLMKFVMSLVNSGYSYIGLNGEGLMYLNDNSALEVCLQTLINAILNDADFGTDSIVALGANGKGQLVNASLQLGNSASEIQYTGLDFTINLTSVPGQMKTVAEYMKLIAPYVNFKAVDGKLAVTVSLPDQVYGAYLMALTATGKVDMTDIKAVNQAIAFEFLYDYLETVLDSDMDLETFTNTMTMLGLNYDLTGYNHIYDKAVNIYKDATTVTFSEDGMAIDLTFEGKKVINGLLKLLGTSVDSTYLSMIKEYNDGEVLTASAVATMSNVGKTYNAMIVDAQASGVTNKYACTSSDSALASKTKSLAGYSVILLLDDVDTDLTISGTTILDLNGHNVDGVITGTGNLYIIDSTRDTYAAGTVEDVSGNVVVIAGNYNNDVSAFLKDGYYMDGTTVRNNMYYVSSASTYAAGASKNAYYVLNTNLISGGIPAYKAIAIDIAADMLLNYWTAAALNIEGNDVYKVDFEDVIGLLTSGSKVDALIEEGIDTIDVPGISNIINIILDDLVDFDAIAEAIENGAPIADYDVTISPWSVNIVHVTENGQNYASIALTNNADNASTYTVGLIVDGEYADELGTIAEELSKIVEDETDISVSFTQPKFDAENNTIVFTDNSATAVVSVDMSVNSDYATMIGVIVAYGNPAKRAAIANAINSGNEIALKAVIDNTTVAEVFTALKAMSRNVSFTSMAATVGVTVDVSSAAELEAVYHVVLCAAGKGLEEADITGKNSKLGNLYNEETGYYELSKEDIYRDVEISKKGYTAIIDMEATELTLKVKIFGEDCMWGDADHDNKVTPYDASLILQYCVGNEFDDYFCTERTDVNGDGSITPYDASIVLQYTVGTVTELPHQD